MAKQLVLLTYTPRELSEEEYAKFIREIDYPAFRQNPHFPVNTLLIMRGLIAARRMGVGDRYLETVLAAMWEQGEKMDDPEVVKRVLEAAGLDGGALIAATQDPQVKAELVANTEAAVARGVFGIPTFFVGDEMFWGHDRMHQVAASLGIR